MASVSAQPNVPGRGIVASYSPRFWMLVVLIGVAAGVGGAALIELLRAVQHLAWSYETGHFLEGAERSSDARRVLVCLGSGAPGGLFTPTLTLGVVLGGVLGDGWLQIWPGTPLGSYAVIGGAAVLAASMQAPLAAVVLLLELTHKVDGLMVPMLLAVVEATVISRLLRARSIYSARLPGTSVDAHEASYGDIDVGVTADGRAVSPGDVFPT